MCPIQVHWHIKKSYREYWRVKMTVNNFNTLKNFSDWNLLVQHPGMQNLTKVFSFNHHPLVQYGTISIPTRKLLMNYNSYTCTYNVHSFLTKMSKMYAS
ncbi:hypothetical protein TRIUR3_29086 [Triticum urartu]|uniref:COBRA C-terminal domain-containing protein n=2 Tax=Triticum TaxID=4564 RepID=A0A9R0XXF2_TRITD|nr:hypothetical protein TRIUR3_29086 [Triticum urartu]VAI44791.1 unnamed protein product [Triticum turgidum subsp. durum]